jgi:hypothetical protein
LNDLESAFGSPAPALFFLKKAFLQVIKKSENNFGIVNNTSHNHAKF